MDHNFTLKLKQWLETEPRQRDYAQGAKFVLQLSSNRIMYNNFMANLEKTKDSIEYQIQKYYNFRVLQLTHDQVEEMATKVEVIAEKHKLDDNDDFEKRTGKRDDHDTLPDEIKFYYTENLSILYKMRELHLKLRSLSLEHLTCPDSERYPFLKELIEFDIKLHENWKKYDTYNPGEDNEKKRTNRKNTKTA